MAPKEAVHSVWGKGSECENMNHFRAVCRYRQGRDRVGGHHKEER